MHNNKSKTFICVTNPKWKTSSAGKLNRKQKQKLKVKMEEMNHKNEEKRKQTEEASWWGNDANGGSIFQVGEDMMGEGCRRRHMEQPIEVEVSCVNAQKTNK